jgi:hypothetical protein
MPQIVRWLWCYIPNAGMMIPTPEPALINNSKNGMKVIGT